MCKKAFEHVWAVAFCLVPLVGTGSAARAGDDLTPFYDNTLIAVDGGIESHFWYKPDHTFTGKVPEYSFDLKGTWSENDDGTICRVFDPPLPMVKNPDCGPMSVHAVGDVAVDTHGHGEKLVAGIQ